MNKISSLLLLALSLCTTGVSHGLPSDKQKPINVTFATSDVDLRKGITVYTGDVVLVQGTLKINCDELTIIGDTKNPEKIIALGSPAVFEQIPNLESAKIVGKGQRIEYEVSNEMMLLQKDAEFSQAESFFKSDEILYDISNERLKTGPGTGCSDPLRTEDCPK